eukprot:6218618-Alexandrium_andersonii.AAC.1
MCRSRRGTTGAWTSSGATGRRSMNAAGMSCPARQATCSVRSFAGAGAKPRACAQAPRCSWVA